MIRVQDLKGRLTLTVPEWGEMFSIGRDAAYSAAQNDQIEGLCRVGRRLVVPTHAALRQLGMSDDLIARALGLDPERTEGDPATGSPTATIHALTKSTGEHDYAPD